MYMARELPDADLRYSTGFPIQWQPPSANSVVLLVLHCLQGQESWFPRPILFLETRPV